jgi:integrase
MPLKLIPPRIGKSPNWTIRGAYLGTGVDRTSGTTVKADARRVLDKIKTEIERGAFAVKGEPTFADAALSYVKATRQRRFILPLEAHFGSRALKGIDGKAIDEAAVAIYPNGSPATRNRQVHTVVSAILRHAGVSIDIKRPKGGQGAVRLHWLWPEQFEALTASAEALDIELKALVTLLVATGLRIGEALAIKTDDVRLAESFIFVGMTKNGEPRPVHLPPAAVEALGWLKPREGRIFRWTKSGLLYVLIKRAFFDAGLDDGGQPFHILRHTYGSWMRRYANMDERGLTDTGAWKDAKSARRYTHTIVSESARKADLLPIRGKSVDDKLDA